MHIIVSLLKFKSVLFFVGVLFFAKNSFLLANPNTPFLGIGFSEFKKDSLSGIRIDYIVPNSVADQSDLKKGDVIYMVDYQHLTSANTTQNFIDYIKKEKAIKEELVLHYFRDVLKISKDIEGDFVDVEYSLNNVVTDVDQLLPNSNLSFKFNRKIEQMIEKIILEPKPLVRTSSPNIAVNLFPSITYISPYYAELIDVLKVYDGFEDHFKSLEKNQFSSEFWDDGLRFPISRYLHINYDKLPSFTRLLHQELGDISVQSSFAVQQRLMDIITTLDKPTYPQSRSFQDHFNFIKSILSQSNELLTQALGKLSSDDKRLILSKTPVIINELSKSFIISGNDNISDSKLSYYFSLINTIDYKALYKGYALLLQLEDPDWLDNMTQSLQGLDLTESDIEGVSGKIYISKNTDFGLFVIGGPDSNTYTRDIPILFDFGGDDTYRNNAGGYHDDYLISLVVDVSGNDMYSSTSDFSQGSGFLGYGLLIDYHGDDLYRGMRLSQGIGIFGCGSLIDKQGNDSFFAQDFSQGVGLGGTGFIYDYNGSDSYTAALFSQAVGLPFGVGSIFDFSGNDTYFLGNRDISSYGSSGIFKGAGQGFGFGVRHIASGGIGFLYDLKGNDRYEAGNFSLGTGYFYGLGIVFDDKGNDVYRGSRYSIASSAHSAIGILKDQRGDDYYHTLFGAAIAIAWDNSNAFFLDEEGDDYYNCLDRNFCLGEVNHNSFSIFNDKDGRDTYLANFNKNSITQDNDDRKSFAIFLDEGGDTDGYQGIKKLNNMAKDPENSFLFLDLKKTLAKYLRQL